MCDAKLLIHILVNLLQNACRFTNTGSVRLVIQAKPGGKEGRRQVFFAVRDSGIGITDEIKASLFTRYKSDSTGTGIGLYISNQARQHVPSA